MTTGYPISEAALTASLVVLGHAIDRESEAIGRQDVTSLTLNQIVAVLPDYRGKDLANLRSVNLKLRYCLAGFSCH